MPFRDLILKNGRICEEADADVGLYPYLHMSGGRLVAGGSGNPLQLILGRIREVIPSTGLYVLDNYISDFYVEGVEFVEAAYVDLDYV